MGTAKIPFTMFAADKDALDGVKNMSDADIGGFSKSTLEYNEASPTEPAHMRWHGSISIDLPKNNPSIQRTGYAGWRTRDLAPTLFGRTVWDISMYRALCLRVKSDGRKYMVNIQTESVVPSDLHQHRLYTKKDGEWETVVLRYGEFVRTNHGMLVEPTREMMKQKVRSVGISLIDRIPGPFELCIEKVWATNFPEDEVTSPQAGKKKEESKGMFDTEEGPSQTPERFLK